MKRPGLIITDHSIVRYLERVGGFDLDRLRREIAQRLQAAADAGAAAVVIEGHAYVIRHDDPRGPAVTTVLPVRPDLPRHVQDGL
ncbi:hypothetical protein RSWS8N_18099 [Cereibacter sphaeroides WS8N]|uniref:hypothetical protein n=1 Tax=Cereibacter sphaeroides TaxID=1063 RepID=UPI00020B0323|nr:hypothetical protein [Cereibacter sphaeroides]EGJ20098.1 hypothetical protein RSWS8N_18099 [Cereibacter sphaeroides WS8N]